MSVLSEKSVVIGNELDQKEEQQGGIREEKTNQNQLYRFLRTE